MYLMMEISIEVVLDNVYRSGTAFVITPLFSSKFTFLLKKYSNVSLQRLSAY
jgi:hypothetical protein